MKKPRSRLLSWLIGSSAESGGSAPSYRDKYKATLALRYLFSSLALTCSTASAENYYWMISTGHLDSPRIQHFNSPAAACQGQAHANYEHDDHDSSLKYINTYSKAMPYPAPRRFDCFTNRIYTIKTKGEIYIRTDYDTAQVYRVGNACPPNTQYNSTTGACTKDDKGKGGPSGPSCKTGSDGPPPYAADPINTSNGNSIQTESDFQGGGVSTLKFVRTYNSLDGLWRHNRSTYLRLDAIALNTLALVMADGRESFFTLSGSTVTASPTELGQLTQISTGWKYVAKNNETFTFDTRGRLTEWSNTSGASYTQTYATDSSTGIIISTTVTDNLGQSLSFTEDRQHQPLTLTAAGVTIQYEYNANQRLSQLTRTRGGQTETRLFHYEIINKPDLLTGITDERGVRYTTWTFDDQDRATSSEHAGGVEHTEVAYNADGSSTVINEFGKKSIYRFVTIDGVKRVSAIEGEALGSCPMSNSTFTYDARGLLKTKTDNKGFVTTYDYNDRGLEITRTEASGMPQTRTTTTTWHTTLNLPLTVTEPGRVTTYTYDAQGRPTGQSSVDIPL